MDERDRERPLRDEPAAAPRVERETTIIHTGERRGGGGVLALLVVLILLAVVAFFLFGGGLEKAADQTDINVIVDTPDITLPDVKGDVPAPSTAPAESGQ